MANIEPFPVPTEDGGSQAPHIYRCRLRMTSPGGSNANFTLYAMTAHMYMADILCDRSIMEQSTLEKDSSDA